MEFLIEEKTSYEALSFIEGYSGYNQKKKYPEDSRRPTSVYQMEYFAIKSCRSA